MPDDLERSLLLAVLAVHDNLVDREALVEAMGEWIKDQSRGLEQILRERHGLSQEHARLLSGRVAEALDRTQADPGPAVTEVAAAVGNGESMPTEAEAGSTRGWCGEPTVDLSSVSGSCPESIVNCQAESASALTAAVPGGAGNRYRILNLLDKGGLGEVYVARDEELDRLVALKLMQDRCASDPPSRERFLLEAGITGALEHPGIVPVHGLGLLSDGRPYYAMKLIKGEPLRDAILAFHREHASAQGSAGRMPGLRRLLHRFLDVCNVIDYAHSRRILHRDLKPANILLGPYGETLVVDWGLAKDLERGSRAVPAWTASPPVPAPEGATPGDETAIRSEPTFSDNPTGTSHQNSTLPGSTLGTPSYMSPEQAAGQTEKIGPAADIYGLGATLYTLLTGKPPCDGPDLASILARVRGGDITPPRQVRPWVPEALAAICMKALSLRPEDRYDSPRALAGDIERWLADEPIAIHRDPLSVRLTRWGRRHRSTAVALGVLMVSAVLGLTVGNFLLSRANRRTEDERNRVQETARSLERQLYIHRVNLAHRACLENDVSQADRLLSLCPESARDWEWYYLARLCHQERLALRGHRESVGAVAFSPDGTKVLSGAGRPYSQPRRDDDAELILWEAASGRELRRFEGLRGGVHGVAFSPDGKWIASASGFYEKAPGGEGRLRVGDAATGAVKFEHTEDYLNALSVAFSPDGRHVAAGFGLYSEKHHPGILTVFELATGKVVMREKVQGGGINALAFHKDSKTLAVAGTGVIGVWDVAAKKKLYDLPGHEDWVYSLAFSLDGRRLASGGWDHTVRIWDLSTRTEERRIRAHTGVVPAVAFSPDGTKVASAGDDNVIKLWDPATGRLLATLRGHTGQATGILGLAISPDGSTIASGGGDRTVMLWDVKADDQVTFRDQKSWITCLVSLPDNRSVVSGSGDRSVDLWDADTGRLTRRLGDHVDWVLCLALSPDGKLLASSGADQEIRVWDLDSGRQPQVLRGSSAFVRGLAFTLDGKSLVSAGGDQMHGPARGELNLWDLASGKLVRTLLKDTRSFNAVAFSPDGDSLAVAVASREGPEAIPSKVVILDGRTLQERLTIVDAPDSGSDDMAVPSGNALSFSPDGKLLAVDGRAGVVTIHDARTGKLERALRGHTTQVSGLAFSPTGRRLASSGFDKLIKLWDTATGEELLSLRGHDGGVVSLAFSPDGDRLYSGGVDHTARVWDARPMNK
jgi:WD40 repeat protein/serine/threonine protein kinase